MTQALSGEPRLVLLADGRSACWLYVLHDSMLPDVKLPCMWPPMLMFREIAVRPKLAHARLPSLPSRPCTSSLGCSQFACLLAVLEI